jgi:hypothetical protein
MYFVAEPTVTMKKNMLSWMPFFLCSLSVFAQESIEVLSEDFETKKRDWNEVQDDEHIRLIENGKLRFATASKTFFWCGQDLDIDKKKNFRIETELTFVKFKSGEAGIMWGAEDEEKMYFFLLSPNGAWNYGVWSPSFFSYTGSQKSALIKKELGTNKLKVERIDNKVKLYINDVEVHSARFPSTKGTRMGLVSGGGIHNVDADYFTVTQMERK